MKGAFGAATAFIVGRVVRDPEVRKAQNSQKEFVTLDLVVNDVIKGEVVAQYYQGIAFGDRAKNLAEHVRKGTPLWISGRQRLETYQGKDETVKTSVKVVINDWGFAGSSGTNGKPVKTAESADELY